MTAANSRRAKLWGMGGLAMVLFLVSMDQTIVSTAMPRIIAELNGFEFYAWVTTAYLLAETAVIPIVGKLGDIYGRRWIMVAGVVIFLLSSILCGMSTTMPWLIATRGIQGIGGGMIFSTIFALVADIFPNLKDRARYQGMLFSVFTLSSIIGPILGGWITDHLSWRWVFYINLPLGVLTLVTLPLVLPRAERQRNASIDYWGAITSTISVITLLLALELIGAGHAWSSPLVLGSFMTALVSFGIFVPIELRAREPIISFELFRNRTISTMSFLLFMAGIMMFGVTLYVPLLLQGVMGISASGSGMLMLPMVITMTVMGIVVGQLVARFERLKLFLLLGTGAASIAILLLTTLQSDSSPYLVSFYLFMVSLGMGMIMPVTTLAVQSAVDHRVLGMATAATQFIRSIGSTIGTAVIGTIVTSRYLAGLTVSAPATAPEAAIEALHNPNALIDPAALTQLTQIVSSLPNGDELLQQILHAARVALTSGVQSGFFLVLASSLLAFGAAWFMPDLRLGRQDFPPQAGEGEFVEQPALH